MAEFPCPYCGHAVETDTQEPQNSCGSCEGNLLIAYRYRLVARRGELSGGELYEARDDGFDERMAVLFLKRDADAVSRERFIEGNRLFAELGGGRGLVRIYEVGGRSERRPYVVMDWLSEGTLESRVTNQGLLDQATLIETAGDLLAGLAKAHRAMPNLVHNHVHPGKIGFLSKDKIVMFGFEWATQVFEQDSTIADAFIESESERNTTIKGERRAADLRQLGVALYYAASGEWIGEQSAMQQRAQARARMQGPLAILVDRLLDAGASGYRTAVDGVMDFENLLRGDLASWRPRILPKELHGGDLAASAWTGVDAELGASEQFAVREAADLAESRGDYNAYADVDDADVEEDEAWEAEDAYDYAEQAASVPARGFESPSSVTPPRAVVNLGHQAGQIGQAQYTQETEQTQQAVKGARTLGIVMFMLIGGGMCVAAIGENIDDDYDAAYEAERIHAEIEAMEVARQNEREQREIAEQMRLADLARQHERELVATRLDGVFHYEGTITGPDEMYGDYQIGDRCEVWVAPSEDALSELNCRWYIDCTRRRTTRRIYGGDRGGNTVGFSSCEVDEDGAPVRAQDEDDDGSDGAFVAELSGPSPMIVVMDRWLLPATKVAISIVGTGERWERRVPNTRLAARVERDTIETAIARNEYPSFEGESGGGAEDSALPDKLATTDIRRVLNAAKPRLAGCELPQGSVVSFELSVAASGQVEGVEFSPPQPPHYADCLGAVLDGLQFPAARESLTFTYRYRP